MRYRYLSSGLHLMTTNITAFVPKNYVNFYTKTMKKKIEVEIPDGKCAKWVNSVLTLVDDDVTKRIKTLEDACAELGEKHPLVTQYRLSVAAAYIGDPMTEDFIAFLKLRIIAAALNEGWEPTFDKDEERWYPWFKIKQGGLVFAYV